MVQVKEAMAKVAGDSHGWASISGRRRECPEEFCNCPKNASKNVIEVN